MNIHIKYDLTNILFKHKLFSNKNLIFKIINTFIFFIIFNLFINNICYANENEPIIESPAAIMMDANTGQILYAKNENEKHYPASITKLMTALLAFETLDFEDTITFSKEAVFSIEYNSSHIGIVEGEILTVEQALHGLLLMSANEVANGIAEKVSGSIDEFANKMNEKAKEIGAYNTHFVNPHGLHDENHYTTAYDMALISKELLKEEKFLTVMNNIRYQIPPTNITDEIRYLAQQHYMMNEVKSPKYYREDVIGGKTGYTDQARHTLVTMAKQGERVLIVVILESSKTGMYEDTNTLLDYGFNNFKSINISSLNDLNGSFNKISITENNEIIGEATINFEEPINILINSSTDKKNIKYESDIVSAFSNNVKIGDFAGTITLKNDENILTKANLIVNSIHLYNKTTVLEDDTKEIKSRINSLYVIAIIIILFLIIFIYSNFISKNHYSKFRRNRYRTYKKIRKSINKK